MKTAISLPDRLFEAAEAAARRMGISRSRLYAEALQAYLAERGDEGVTELLNEVYPETDSKLDPVLARMQWASLPREDW